MTRFDAVWEELDELVATGWLPGAAAAVRHGGEVAAYATGALALGEERPVTTDTPFRIASLSKPVGAVVTLALVADGILSLDDAVGRWLPELAQPQVLREPAADLDDTVPARSPILVRHLLTQTMGLGLLMSDTPLARALYESGVGPGPNPPGVTADEFLTRISALPLVRQPGESWLYHTGIDVLSVLIARAAGRSPADLLARYVTDPLGLGSMGFWADPGRLPVAYEPTGAGFEVSDPADGVFGRPPDFESFGAGLVCSAPDYLRFLAAVADGELLPAALNRALIADQLTDSQRAELAQLTGPGRGWGLGVSVDLESVKPWMTPGRFGWTGGSGTSAFADPARDVVGVVFTQRQMTRADEDFGYFWRPVYEAL